MKLLLVTTKIFNVVTLQLLIEVLFLFFKTSINNYRPISMLSNFSKIFEKIIKSRFMAFLEYNKLLSHNQSGFRSGRRSSLLCEQIY